VFRDFREKGESALARRDKEINAWLGIAAGPLPESSEIDKICQLVEEPPFLSCLSPLLIPSLFLSLDPLSFPRSRISHKTAVLLGQQSRARAINKLLQTARALLFFLACFSASHLFSAIPPSPLSLSLSLSLLAQRAFSTRRESENAASPTAERKPRPERDVFRSL